MAQTLRALLHAHTNDIPLLGVASGSRLYGTHHAHSDIDHVRVIAPRLDSLLLTEPQQSRHTIDPDTGIDTHTHPLSTFVHMLAKGAMIPMESIFAPSTYHIHTAHPVIAYLRDHAKDFVSPHLGSAAGFCSNMLNTYAGNPQERVDTLDWIIGVFSSDVPTTRAVIDIIMHDGRCPKDSTIDTVQGTTQWMLYGRKIDVDLNKKNTTKILHDIRARYAKQATNHANDAPSLRKGLMHAVRIAEQVQEFRDTGTITFPRPNAAYLLGIREGTEDADAAYHHARNIMQSLPVTEDSMLSERVKPFLLEASVQVYT